MSSLYATACQKGVAYRSIVFFLSSALHRGHLSSFLSATSVGKYQPHSASKQQGTNVNTSASSNCTSSTNIAKAPTCASYPSSKLFRRLSVTTCFLHLFCVLKHTAPLQFLHTRLTRTKKKSVNRISASPSTNFS